MAWLSSWAASALAAGALAAGPSPERAAILDLSAPAVGRFVWNALGTDPVIVPAGPGSPRALELKLPATSDGWTELDFAFPEHFIRSDWSGFAAAELDVENRGDEPLVVGLRLRNVPASDAEGSMAAFSGLLAPGQRGRLRAPLLPLTLSHAFARWPSQGPFVEVESDGSVELSRIVEVGLFFDTRSERRLRLRRVELAEPLPKGGWIDAFGQSRLAEWPGKAAAERELAEADAAEAKALAAAPPAPGRDELGASLEEPGFEAGHFFRLERRDERWWLVSPSGRPFFATCVGGVSPDTAARWDAARRKAYSWVPPRRGRFSAAWLDAQDLARPGEPRWWPSYYRANLARKWGDALDRRFAERAFARLAAWGFNCVGPWSDERFARASGLPRFSEGPEPGLSPADALEPDFAARAEAAAAPLSAVKDDPNVIGHFFDDEQDWESVRPEALAETAGRYCEGLARAIRKADPNHLLLGPRLTTAVSTTTAAAVARACAPHADAVSFDDFFPEPTRGPAGKPRLVSAYSFNSLDDGLLSASNPAASREERGVGLRRYLEACAADRDCVGASYYQYIDEPLTGRADGDTGLNGLVSVVDAPYGEVVEAARASNERIYDVRRGRLPPTERRPRR